MVSEVGKNKHILEGRSHLSVHRGTKQKFPLPWAKRAHVEDDTAVILSIWGTAQQTPLLLAWLHEIPHYDLTAARQHSQWVNSCSFTRKHLPTQNNQLIYTTIPETAGHNLWRSPLRPVDSQPESFLHRWINSCSSSLQEGKLQGHYTWKDTHCNLNDPAAKSYYNVCVCASFG